jgi:hypothetical protein
MAVAENETNRTLELTDAHPGAQQWTLRLRPELRPRRAPVAGQHGRY